MSVQSISRVWAHSMHKGSALVLMLAIADFAHDDGSGAFPSLVTLAKKTRLTRRHTQRLLREVERSGEVRVTRRRGRSHVMRVAVGYEPSGPTPPRGGGPRDASPAPGATGPSDTPVVGGAACPSPEPSSTVTESSTELQPDDGPREPAPTYLEMCERAYEDNASRATLEEVRRARTDAERGRRRTALDQRSTPTTKCAPRRRKT